MHPSQGLVLLPDHHHGQRHQEDKATIADTYMLSYFREIVIAKSLIGTLPCQLQTSPRNPLGRSAETDYPGAAGGRIVRPPQNQR